MPINTISASSPYKCPAAAANSLLCVAVIGLQGEAVLVVPLPALLSCVYRLSNAAAQQAAAAADLNKGPGSLEASENWMGDDDNNQEQQEQSTSAILKVNSLCATALLPQHRRSTPSNGMLAARHSKLPQFDIGHACGSIWHILADVAVQICGVMYGRKLVAWGWLLFAGVLQQHPFTYGAVPAGSL